MFSQSLSSPHANESDFSWRVLEKADAAFVAKNYSRAAKLVQIAKINPDYKFHIRRHPYIPCWDMNLYCV